MQKDSKTLEAFENKYLKIVRLNWKYPKVGSYEVKMMIFFDFQLKSFVDPKPVELWESAIYQKLRLSKLVWLQK